MSTEAEELDALADALAQIGRRVRDAVRATVHADDEAVVRTEGGDDVYGVDARAEDALLAGLAELGARWPGRLITEGFDDPLPIGDGGAWVYLADPVDGTRPYLAGLRSAKRVYTGELKDWLSAFGVLPDGVGG